MNIANFCRVLLLIMLSSISFQAFAQNLVPFTPRFDDDLKGDILTIGNTVLGPSNDPLNTDIGNNSNVNMLNIDIDSDSSTFNSSSAELVIPNPNCYVIREATLYWGAVEPEDNTSDDTVRQVKFKGPSGGYIDITGDIIYRDESTDLNSAYPYACVADVTDIVQSYPSNLGYYTVANIATKTGVGNNATPRNRNGYTAGWSLFIVYEDPTLPSKSITSFDGFSAIFRDQAAVDINIDGFRTLPFPQPVRANLAFATLEGDLSLGGDRMSLNGTDLSTIDRPAGNFFRSLVTQLDAQPVDNRIPNSSNTLGFDTGVISVPNPGNNVIANGDTSAIMSLTTTSDFFLQYFFAFAVEIIEPKIVLTKLVEDEFGNDISDQVVNLGQELNYVISFENVGNDDGREFTIRDVLPINIVFDYPAGLDLPAGVNPVSYNPTTRELILSVEDYLIEENDPVVEFRIQVNVVDTCSHLVEACSNLIQNQAFGSYIGTINPDFVITDDPSVSSNTGCLLVPQATNFLADIDDCEFEENAILCGESTVLTAADGYATYSWSTDPSGIPVIATTQSLTVTESGTYYVFNTAPAPCRSIIQIFNVVTYGEDQTNPILPQADEIVTCPDDGKLLPNIFLCGLNDFRELTADITDSNSIIWEQLDETSCPPVSDIDCANEDGGCVWNQVATGSDFTVNTAGQFRLTVNYDGGCFNQFFFNVYQNILDPTVVVTDILCDSLGTITVNNVPSNYEFSLDGINYQDSNVFNVSTAGVYTVYIRQINVPVDACVFTVLDVLVRERDFTFDAGIIQPLCHGDLGSIQVVAIDAEPQYTFSIFEGGVLVNTVGPIIENNYNFENLGPGIYTATVETEDGCIDTQEVTIIEPPLLTLTADLIAPFIDCLIQAVDSNGNPIFDEDDNPVYEEAQGEINMNANGGTPPYVYFINSTTVFQSDPVYLINSAGTYNITVVDANNCEATTTLEVEEILPPDFTVSSTNILCSDSGNSGVIEFMVTNTNGSSLEYSIDNGISYSNSSVFVNLAPGTYETLIRYTFGPSSCTTDPQSVIIEIPDPIIGNVSITENFTCTTGAAEITVTDVSGGTPTYTYSIDGVNFQSGTVFSGLTEGSYTIVIQDANGCTFTTEAVVVLPLDPPTNLDFTNTPITCPSNTSDVTITATGGVSPLEFRIIAPVSAVTAYQSSNIFTGLSPDIYTFEVRDANECIYSEQHVIDALSVISVSAQTQNDVTCVGGSDGAILVTVSGTTNFEYSVNGAPSIVGTSPILLTGLAAGSYTIVIQDLLTNCQATSNIETIDEPVTPLQLTADENPITCNDGGSVLLAASGGWGGYTFTLTQPDSSIVGPQSNNTFTSLSLAGLYTVTVEDINGCQESTTFNLTIPEDVEAEISNVSDLCYDGTDAATIEVTVNSGVAPFEYSMNGAPFQSSNVFNNLIPGSYTIVVRDAYGCTVTLPASIIAPEITVSAVLSDNLDCTVSTDAEITVTVGGGTPPFSYEVAVDGNPYSNQGSTPSPFTYNTAAAGSYQFRITDDEGCTAESNVVVVNPLSPPEIDLVVVAQAIRCNGDENGTIDVTIDMTAGTPPFLINVFNTTSSTDYGTQTSGLPAGDYTITLTDGNECTDIETITISEPDPIIVDIEPFDITCEAGGISLGEIRVNSIIGGTGLYDIYVTGASGYMDQALDVTGTTAISFDVIEFGLYQVNVIDENGCSLLTQDILIASPPNDLDIIVNSTVDCTAGGTTEVSVSTVLGSSGPFFFAIYTDPVPVYPNPVGDWFPESSPGSVIFTGLTPGLTYTFMVYDAATMCTYFETADIPIPTDSTLSVSAPDIDNITCTGNGDGDVSFTVTSIYGTDVAIDYEIFNSLNQITTGVSGMDTVSANSSITVSDLGPLGVGNYYVLVSETSGSNSGCGVITASFNINESQIPLDLSVNIDQDANCNLASGIITAIGQDGTSPYQYQITTTATAPLATDPSWADQSVFNVDAGTYYVHVQDAYGCIVTSPAQIVDMDPSPVVNAVVANSCNTPEGDFEIDVTLTTAGAPPYSFSIDGGAFQVQTIPFTLSGLSSGTHTVEVQDANGCGNSISLDILAPLAPSVQVIALSSCDDDDGEIEVNASGGSGNYTYTIAPNPASVTLTGNIFSGVPSGTYIITVGDADPLSTCTATIEITLDAPTPVTFETDVTDVSCFAGNDGSITVTLLAGNDNPIYTYEIIAPIIVPAQNSNIFLDLPADTYTVQVNSGRGCFEMADITIDQPSLLEASAIATEFMCAPDNSVNSSMVTITGSGGTAPYSYSIDGTNYSTTNTFTILDTGSVQTIDVFVTDANGCTGSNTVTINPLPTITAAAIATINPIDCNGTGEVTIDVTGGSGNFNYQLLPDGTPQTSNTFALANPGTYFFQVNDLDTNCYFLTDPFVIDPFDTIEATISTIQDIDCFENTIGQMELTVSGYTGDYEYQVLDSTGTPVGPIQTSNTSNNPQLITGLEAGNYTISVTATESPFCVATSNTENIATPIEALSLSASESFNVTCTNDQGIITAIGSGGTPPYEYELDGASTVPFSSNGTFENLSAGSYDVTVRDANGCLHSETILLEVPDLIDATFVPSTTQVTCFGDQSASITITNVTGGQGADYNYTLNRIFPNPSTFGPQTSNTFTNLGAGLYSVTIQDPYSCELISDDITITEPDQIQASLVLNTAQTCATEATLTLTASGGIAPYTYSETSDFSNPLGTFTSSVSFTVPVGSYQYYIRDANGCIDGVFNEITIDPLLPLEVNFDSLNPAINCVGDSTGSIIATAQGGVGDYIYTLQDSTGATIPISQNPPGTFEGLSAGIYIVLVESGDCEAISETIEITEPENGLDATLDITEITCRGANDGILEISTTGGTGMIQYAISPNLDQFFDINVFENLEPGDYVVIVQDELGCFLTLEFTLIDPEAVILGIVADSIFPEQCSGEQDGSFSVDISGGSLPYSVSLDNENGPYTTGEALQTVFTFTNLSGGDHIVYIRDNQGCESVWNISFPESVTLNPLVDVEYLCIDNLPSNVVTVTVDDSITDLTLLEYSLNGGPYQSSNVFTDIPFSVANYILVRHANGCIQSTDFFDIDLINPLSLFVVEGNYNEIIATATGGFGNYEYTFNDISTGSENVFIISETGTYRVTVTDQAGCIAEAEIFIEFVDVCIPNYFTPNNDGVADTWAPGCVDNYPNLKTKIFDRYGRVVAFIRPGYTWNGEYDGKELPSGDYWYVVTLGLSENDRQFVGHFTLYR
ncbi:T9SS type B sorting domain-containing protein [uncultured Dokdonia sp.]|uniref:T9SS type B sorting domain-containing protein n=1 Tax=uncultured Dokdonia sp. TaxID=575653 RepID=UPI002612A085|nr:T9SS type B sorting domain-containing protein [uncultured Dokdonia sp.]